MRSNSSIAFVDLLFQYEVSLLYHSAGHYLHEPIISRSLGTIHPGMVRSDDQADHDRDRWLCLLIESHPFYIQYFAYALWERKPSGKRGGEAH